MKGWVFAITAGGGTRYRTYMATTPDQAAVLCWADWPSAPRIQCIGEESESQRAEREAYQIMYPPVRS